MILITGLNAKIFDLFVQGVAVNAQEVGGLGLHAAAFGQCAVDQRVLDLVDHELIYLSLAKLVVGDSLICQPAGEGFNRFARLRRAPLCGKHAHAQGEQLFVKILVIAQDHCTLDGILQLADVAGPRITHQDVEHVPADAPQPALVLDVVLIEKKVDEPGNILAAIPQRREIDRNDVQAIKKIFPEISLRDLFLKIDVGGGDDADVNLDGVRVTDALELALLENAEKLHLKLGLKGADLVEKNGAAVGCFEAALLVADRAGKRAFDMPEEFTFQESAGEGAAVDADEAALAAR